MLYIYNSRFQLPFRVLTILPPPLEIGYLILKLTNSFIILPSEQMRNRSLISVLVVFLAFCTLNAHSVPATNVASTIKKPYGMYLIPLSL